MECHRVAEIVVLARTRSPTGSGWYRTAVWPGATPDSGSVRRMTSSPPWRVAVAGARPPWALTWTVHVISACGVPEGQVGWFRLFPLLPGVPQRLLGRCRLLAPGLVRIGGGRFWRGLRCPSLFFGLL